MAKYEVGQKVRFRGFSKFHTITKIIEEDNKTYCLLENGMKVDESGLVRTDPQKYYHK